MNQKMTFWLVDNHELPIDLPIPEGFSFQFDEVEEGLFATYSQGIGHRFFVSVQFLPREELGTACSITETLQVVWAKNIRAVRELYSMLDYEHCSLGDLMDSEHVYHTSGEDPSENIADSLICWNLVVVEGETKLAVNICTEQGSIEKVWDYNPRSEAAERVMRLFNDSFSLAPVSRAASIKPTS